MGWHVVGHSHSRRGPPAGLFDLLACGLGDPGFQFSDSWNGGGGLRGGHPGRGQGGQESLPNVVFNEVFGLSPRHKHKFVALVHMKQSGIAINDALQLLDRIAEMSMWDDVEDVKKRHQIVRQVYSSPYHIQVRA